MVAALRELDETVEDRLGPLDGDLFPAQQYLVSANDDLALDKLLDPPQDRVPVPEDLQHAPRRYHYPGLYPTTRRNIRYSSLTLCPQSTARQPCCNRSRTRVESLPPSARSPANAVARPITAPISLMLVAPVSLIASSTIPLSSSSESGAGR